MSKAHRVRSAMGWGNSDKEETLPPPTRRSRMDGCRASCSPLDPEETMIDAADSRSMGFPPDPLPAIERGPRSGESLEPVDDRQGTLAPSEGRGRWIRLMSRVGLWGTAIGLAPVAFDMLVTPWVWTVYSILTEVGLVVGGAGILATALLVLTELGRGIRPVKLAALAGVPLGAAFVFMGGLLLLESTFPPTPLMARLFWAAIPVSAVLGMLVLVLLTVAFFRGLPEQSEE